MKRAITLILMGAAFALIAHWSATAQNFQVLDKSVLPQNLIEQVIQHSENPFLRAAGLPQKTHGYAWITNTWTAASYMETEYFPNGLSHIETNYDVTTSQPTERSTYTYDASWRVTEIFTETHESGSWENMMKMTISYDSHGNLFEMMYSYWTGTGWWIIGGMRYTYSYTAQNYVSGLMYQTYDFYSGWLNYMNEIYTLAGNGYPTEILIQKSEAGWADSARYVNIEWHEYYPLSGYGLESYAEEELWDGSQWDPSLRQSTVYEDDGGWVMTEQAYAGGWVNSVRETMDMNNQLPLNYKHEEWQSGAWVLLTGEMYLYTFSGENLTEEIIQVFDPGLMAYVNNTKYVYSDFFYTTGQQELKTGSGFSLFPNPAGGELNVQMDNETVSEWTLEILNVNGQQVMTRTVDFSKGSLITLPLNDLPKGMYLLRLSSGRELHSRTLLKL